MERLRTILRRVLDALTLRDEVYREMRDAPDAVEQGVMLIVTVGVIAALAGVVGTALQSVTVPDVAAIQQTVADGILDMPWAEDLSPRELDEAHEGIRASMAQSQIIASMFAPNPVLALTGIVTKPVGMVVWWLIYGVLAFACARLLGGRGTLGQTYGTTALAASPQLVGVFHVMPYVSTAGLGMWALICSYLALKHTHELSPGRTFWATLLPLLVPLLLIFLAVLGVFILGLVIGGLAS